MSNQFQTTSLKRRSSHLIALISLGLTLLLVVPSARSEGDSGSDLWSPTRLQMFVDELPAIPKLYGYGVVDGKPVSKSLQIGMFYKKWEIKLHCPFYHRGRVYSRRSILFTAPLVEATIDGLWNQPRPP